MLILHLPSEDHSKLPVQASACLSSKQKSWPWLKSRPSQPGHETTAWIFEYACNLHVQQIPLELDSSLVKVWTKVGMVLKLVYMYIAAGIRYEYHWWSLKLHVHVDS